MIDCILAGGDPFTLMLIAGAAMTAGAGVQAYGARKTAKAEKEKYEYNAAVDRADAEQRRISSLEEQQIQREKMRRHLATQRTKIAKSGILLEGSPLEVQLKTAEVYAKDIGMLAYGAELEAGRYESRARLAKFSGRAAEQAGRIGVGSALIGGASDIAMLGMNYELNK